MRHLVTCDAKNTVLEHVNVFIEDGVIRHIGNEVFEADEVLDGSHRAMYPGLVNARHHLYQYFTRNLPFTQGLELFPWLKILYGVWKGMDEDAVYWSSKAAMAELLTRGCTTVFDHHYVFPQGASDLMGAQVRAASDLGVRLHLSRGSMDLSEKDGGLPPDSVVQTVDQIMADSARVVELYHDPAPYSMCRVALAPCSPFSVTGRSSARVGRARARARRAAAHAPLRDSRRGALGGRGARHAPTRVHGVARMGGR